MRQVLTASLVDNALSFIAPRYLSLLNNRAGAAALLLRDSRKGRKATTKGLLSLSVLLLFLFFFSLPRLAVEGRRTSLVIEARD